MDNKNSISEHLQLALASFSTEFLEGVFLSAFKKNISVFSSKEFLQKQSTSELTRQIGVMSSLAAVRYQFSEDSMNTLCDNKELHSIFSSFQSRGRISDWFVEQVMNKASGKKWTAKMSHIPAQYSGIVDAWDDRVFFDKKLTITCLLCCYFEFSLATLREFSVSKTAYKRSKSLRELHLDIADSLKEVCFTLPLHELSLLMNDPLDRAIIAQKTPLSPLLPAVI